MVPVLLLSRGYGVRYQRLTRVSRRGWSSSCPSRARMRAACVRARGAAKRQPVRACACVRARVPRARARSAQCARSGARACACAARVRARAARKARVRLVQKAQCCFCTAHKTRIKNQSRCLHICVPARKYATTIHTKMVTQLKFCATQRACSYSYMLPYKNAKLRRKAQRRNIMLLRVFCVRVPARLSEHVSRLQVVTQVLA